MTCTKEPLGPKLPLPGLVKAQILWQGAVPGIISAANVLHLRWTDNINHPLLDMQQLAVYFKQQWELRMLPFIAGAYKTNGYILTSLGGDGIVSTLAGGSPGTGTGLPQPPQCAVCISWKNGLTARGGRSRTYLPGVPGSATLQGGSPVLTAAFSTALADAALAFNNDLGTHAINGVQTNLGVPSYYHQCQFRPTPLFFPVQTVLVHERLDSQRRRSGKESTFPVQGP